eukprot:6561356-Alexandrium_andersonii.AAC.1
MPDRACLLTSRAGLSRAPALLRTFGLHLACKPDCPRLGVRGCLLRERALGGVARPASISVKEAALPRVARAL